MTFEHLDIRNFTVAGVRNSGGMMLAIQDLNTQGRGPAIVQPADGLIIVVGAKFTGTGATAHAVSNAVSNNGHLYLRNASVVSGYSDVLPGQGPSVAEHMSHTPISLFPSPTRSLNLPIQETPELPWDSNFSHWANVMGYGANPYDNKDDSAAIQAAIDSGKPIIYFPMAKNPTVPNYFTISHTIIIRGNVQKILGLGSIFRLGNPLAQSSDPIFRVENTTGNAIFFDNISINRQGANSPVFIEHASPKTVVIRNAALGAHSYRAVPGAGDLFVEDVEGTTYQFVAGQHVWARQINPEESGAGTLIHNDGASLWILGLKTEGADTVVETLSGGSTEILGAELGWNNGSSHPMFINHESSFTANYYLNSSGWYNVHVRETRDGITKDLLPSQLPADWWAYVTLYTGM
jgi:hypothetical protein